MKLKDLGNIPFGLSVLEDVYPSNKAIVNKANRLCEAKEIIRLKRGLYVVNPEISDKKVNEFLIANHLYGPSYVSKQSALRFYGLIPERVYEITSMTTRLAKSYVNTFAKFTYTHCPADYFGVGVKPYHQEGLSFLIASPEKALCDMMIYSTRLNLRFMHEMRSYLEDDIRFDMSQLADLNLDLLREIKEVGMKKQMISLLIKFIENERNV